LAYANGKQDSMPMKMDCNQWTDVWEHRQDNSMVLRFGSRSEITELSGSNGVRTFRTKLEFVSRYLVSMRTRCSPRPPRRGI